MHELSLVMNIISIAEEEISKQADVQHVESIELEMGDLAGVELSAFEFAWTAVVKDTMLEDAKRIIQQISGYAKCMDCLRSFGLVERFEACPQCGSYNKEILRGQELRIISISVN